MSLQKLLLVDDSEAILAYETAALSGSYSVTPATGVAQALGELARARFDLVLLDLSMPDRDGDELIAIMRADARLSDVPIIVVSSEHGRAAACLDAGAVAFLRKPVSADALRVAVERALADAERRASIGSVGVLFAEVGGVRFGVLLDNVHAGGMQPKTERIELDDGTACESFELRGDRVFVLDLARRLGVAHDAPLVDRKLVLLDRPPRLVGFAVDEVSDPVVCPPSEIDASDSGAGGMLATAVRFRVRRTTGASTPVVDPVALFAPAVQDALSRPVGA